MRTRLSLLAGLVALGLGLFFLRGPLFDFHLEGPPVADVTKRQRTVERSVVMAPISIDLAEATRLANAAIAPKEGESRAPIASGTTESLALDVIRGMLGLEVQEKVECKPTESAKLAQRALNCMGGEDFLELSITKKLTKMLECGVKGSVDSALTLFRAADACIDEHVPLPVPDRSTEVAYDIYLELLSFKAEGGQLLATAQTRVALNPPKSVFDIFVKKPKATCSVRVTGRGLATPGVAIVDNLPHLDIDVSQVALGPGEPCGGRTGGQAKKIMSAIEKNLLQAMTLAFQKKLKEMVEDTLNAPEFVQKFEARKTLFESALFAVHDLPLEQLPVSARLRLAPEGIRLSQPIVGRSKGGDAMVIAAGLVARPEIALTPLKAQKPKTLPYTLQAFDNAFHVTPTARLPLDQITPVAEEIARAVIADAVPELSYDDLSLAFYQADERIVIGATVTGVGWLKVSGTVYLTARPEFDKAANRLALRDVKFDLDSNQFLTRRAAWVLESPLEALLSERLSFDLGAPFQALLVKLEDMELGYPVEAPVAIARIQVRDVSLDQTWLSENTLFVSVAARGTAEVSVD